MFFPPKIVCFDKDDILNIYCGFTVVMHGADSCMGGLPLKYFKGGIYKKNLFALNDVFLSSHQIIIIISRVFHVFFQIKIHQ